MQIVILEPLGIEKEEVAKIFNPIIKDNELIYYDKVAKSEDEIINRAKECEVLIITQSKINKNIIDNCPNLKYINVAFTGTDHVDINYCKEKGILVSNASGYSTSAVSELVFALIIDLNRHIKECDIATRNNKDKTNLIGNEIAGKTIGIIGMGKIGSNVSKIASAFGMNVLVYSRHLKESKEYELVSLKKLLQESDIITIHLNSNETTKDFISYDEFKLMKKEAILINTSRGPIVNQEALVNALNNKQIAGAGIDVYNNEPPLSIDNPLLTAPNTILTPHIGFATIEAFKKRAAIVSYNLEGYLNKEYHNLIK